MTPEFSVAREAADLSRCCEASGPKHELGCVEAVETDLVADLAKDSEWTPVVFTREEGDLIPPADEPAAEQWIAALGVDEVRALLAQSRDGYWHFERVHNLVLERGYECTDCHSAQVPFYAATTRAQKAAQTQVCDTCHLAPAQAASVPGARRLLDTPPD